MKALVESLSWSSGAVLIAVLSAGIVWLLCSVSPVSFHKVWVVIVPFASANCLYWSQPWFEAKGSEYEQALVWAEYHTWALAFIVPWFLAGAIPSAAIVGILRRRRGPLVKR
jgi:hypothetical protein